MAASHGSVSWQRLISALRGSVAQQRPLLSRATPSECKRRHKAEKQQRPEPAKERLPDDSPVRALIAPKYSSRIAQPVSKCKSGRQHRSNSGTGQQPADQPHAPQVRHQLPDPGVINNCSARRLRIQRRAFINDSGNQSVQLPVCLELNPQATPNGMLQCPLR